jgi:hypothetical protein
MAMPVTSPQSFVHDELLFQQVRFVETGRRARAFDAPDEGAVSRRPL